MSTDFVPASADPFRYTANAHALARALADRPLEPIGVMELAHAAGLGRDTARRGLAKMVSVGWMTTQPLSLPGRPQYTYCLTPEGMEQVQYLLTRPVVASYGPPIHPHTFVHPWRANAMVPVDGARL